MTPADIPSLVAELNELLAKATPGWCGAMVSAFGYRARAMRNPDDTKEALRDRSTAGQIATAMARIIALLDALSPKEAELVKPPREYEVSGDAVGEVQDGLSRAIAAQLPDIANIGARTPAVGGIPAGMALVPREPTEAMAKAVLERTWLGEEPLQIDWEMVAEVLRVMIAAAPAYTPKAPTASHDAARERIADDWACPDCRCRTFARIDIMLIDGSFAPGPNVRCVSCKADWRLLAALPTTDGVMREALDGVMVGGNHLAHVLIGKLGAGFAEKFPPETDPQEALRVLCATDTFEIWCCWRTIMLARAKVSAVPLFDEGRL